MPTNRLYCIIFFLFSLNVSFNDRKEEQQKNETKLLEMPDNVSVLRNSTELGESRVLAGSSRPAWAVTALASVLIFTTVVDILGNLLVIISVLRNRKLRNAGKANQSAIHFLLFITTIR